MFHTTNPLRVFYCPYQTTNVGSMLEHKYVYNTMRRRHIIEPLLDICILIIKCKWFSEGQVGRRAQYTGPPYLPSHGL